MPMRHEAAASPWGTISIPAPPNVVRYACWRFGACRDPDPPLATGMAWYPVSCMERWIWDHSCRLRPAGGAAGTAGAALLAGSAEWGWAGDTAWWDPDAVARTIAKQRTPCEDGRRVVMS